MRTSFRVRAAAVAAAVALPFAGLLAAAPAQAEVLAPVISLDTTTFPAGDWGTGFHIVGTGFVGTGDVEVTVGARGENGGGGIYTTTVPVTDGAIDAQVVPDASTEVPNEAGFPQYFVFASQPNGETYLNSNQVALTITPGASASIPAQVAPEQLAAGITGTFAGFGADEAIFYGVGLFRLVDGEYEFIDSDEADTVAGPDGSGTFTAAIAGAQIGDQLRFYVDGDETGRFVEGFGEVVEAPAPAPAPVPADSTPKPALAETGVELTAGLVGAGVLALGVLALLARRRFATR